MRILDPQQRRRFARHHPSGEMLQTVQRQIRQNQPVRAQFLEETDFLDLLRQAFGGPARRHGAKPFAVADLPTFEWRQETRHPDLPRGGHRRSDDLEQDLLVVPLRGDHQTPDVPLAEQEIMMLDQPRPSARDELGMVENGGRLPAKIGHQPAFGMGGDLAASEQPKCRGMMLEQGPMTPAIECPDRGNLRRHAIQLPAEMIEDLRRNELHGVERSAGYFEEPDLEGERQAVQRAPPFPNRGKFALVESEEMLDLER